MPGFLESARQQENITRHILPTSATMVGVCMTVISISKSIYGSRLGTLFAQMLSIDGILFMASAVFSYLSLRSLGSVAELERRADTVFIFGLVLMCLIGLLLAFELL